MACLHSKPRNLVFPFHSHLWYVFIPDMTHLYSGLGCISVPFLLWHVSIPILLVCVSIPFCPDSIPLRESEAHVPSQEKGGTLSVPLPLKSFMYALTHSPHPPTHHPPLSPTPRPAGHVMPRSVEPGGKAKSCIYSLQHLILHVCSLPVLLGSLNCPYMACTMSIVAYRPQLHVASAMRPGGW